MTHGFLNLILHLFFAPFMLWANASPLGKFGAASIGIQTVAGTAVLPTITVDKLNATGFRPTPQRIRTKAARGQFMPVNAEIGGFDYPFTVECEMTDTMLKAVIEHMFGAIPVTNVVTPSQTLDWGSTLALSPLTLDVSQPSVAYRYWDAQITSLKVKWNSHDYITGSIEGIALNATQLYQGTVTATAASVAVVGVGTNFDKEIRAGDRVIVAGQERIVAAAPAITATTFSATLPFTSSATAVPFSIISVLTPGVKYADQHASVLLGGSSFKPEEGDFEVQVPLEYVYGINNILGPAAILRPADDEGHLKAMFNYSLRGANTTLDGLNRNGGSTTHQFSLVRGGSIFRINTPQLEFEKYDPSYDNGPVKVGIVGMSANLMTALYS